MGLHDLVCTLRSVATKQKNDLLRANNYFGRKITVSDGRHMSRCTRHHSTLRIVDRISQDPIPVEQCILDMVGDTARYLWA